jgi:hypothetical protein
VLVGFGLVLVSSSFQTSASGVRTWPSPASGWDPWWMQAMEGGSGRSLANKLAAGPDRAGIASSPLSPSHCGDGWRLGGRIRCGSSIWCRLASEKGSRRWIWSTSSCRCSSLSSFSTATKLWRPLVFPAFFLDGSGVSSCGAAAPSILLAEGRHIGVLAPLLGCRLQFLFLPAKVPKGRQFDFSSTSAVSLLCGSWWCCCGDLNAPSGFVPGGGEIGSMLMLFVRTRTTLQLISFGWGPFCNVQGPSYNFFFLTGLWASCTVFTEII